MVILDKVKVRPGGPIAFIISLFTEQSVDVKTIGCGQECGKFTQSEDCMLDNAHVNNMGFANNIFFWMKRVRAGQNNDEVMHLGYDCLLAHHTNENIPGCRQCFERRETSKLSQFTFLISLKADKEAGKMLECFFEDTSDSKDLQLMPDIMCHYELPDSYKLDFDLDLNLRSKERLALSTDSSNKYKFDEVAMVTVIKWKNEDPNDASEKAAFTECYISLARNCKVVLISVEKRYLWMVQSESHLKCKECADNVHFGPQFSYNQYLRQIPVLGVEEFARNPNKRKRASSEKRRVHRIKDFPQRTNA
ncbi:hypothetical protein ABG067_006886 [Albugo candida]